MDLALESDIMPSIPEDVTQANALMKRSGAQLHYLEMIIWITQYISGGVHLIFNVNAKSIPFSQVNSENVNR